MSEADFVGEIASLLNRPIAFDGRDNDVPDLVWGEGDFLRSSIGDFPMQIDEGVVNEHNHLFPISEKPISRFTDYFLHLQYVFIGEFFFPLVDVIVLLLKFSLVTEHFLLRKIEIFGFFILKHTAFPDKLVIVFGVKIVIIEHRLSVSSKGVDLEKRVTRLLASFDWNRWYLCLPTLCEFSSSRRCLAAPHS